MHRIPDRRVRSVPAIAILLVMGFVAYPLSMGPAFWLCTDPADGFRIKNPVLDNAYKTFYAPLYWAYDVGPQPLRRAFVRYLEAWGMP